MKVGHIILAHKNQDQLKRLILSLNDPYSLTVVHLDRKTNIKDYKEIMELPAVFFVKNRISVQWGGFSQVTAVLNSLKELFEIDSTVQYVNLLSGQDYPIQRLSNFYEFLSKRPKSAFMEFVTVDDPWLQQAKERFDRYHLADFSFFGKYKIENLMNSLLPARAFPSDFHLVGKSQWFTIDNESAHYILNFIRGNKNIVKNFRYSWGADELFFQSILYNSPLKGKLVNNNLRYIDWSENKSSPKTLLLSDMHQINHSNCFFARKFDLEVDSEVFAYIDKHRLA